MRKYVVDQGVGALGQVALNVGVNIGQIRGVISITPR